MVKPLLSYEVTHEFAGRMYESVDIRRAIETGEIKTISDVLSFVMASARKYESDLREQGSFDGQRILTREEFEAMARDTEQHLMLAAMDASSATPQ
ncbi:hypothetical protein [Burkholderia contaminans]|uniref:hypothetical protein n=1 Tax=Burkholderia contaminans TaxID=488447 RepID=UPI000CFF09BA|nr:hypothetical protein [Burkholderia contaminans]PRD96879.1 hypothetical protein C6P88_02955 [Burkholderia contaminans]